MKQIGLAIALLILGAAPAPVAYAQASGPPPKISCEDVKAKVTPDKPPREGRKHELTLNDAEIAACFPAQARRLVQLINTVTNQKNSAERYRGESWNSLQFTQLAVIVLGALATILLGLGSDEWKKRAIVATALITALTAVDAFYDNRGAVVRHMKVHSDMGVLESEIHDVLLALVAVSQTAQVRDEEIAAKLKDWAARRDTILKASSDQYQASFTKKE